MQLTEVFPIWLNYITKVFELNRMKKLQSTLFKRHSNDNYPSNKLKKNQKTYGILNYSSRLNYVIILSLIFICLIVLSLNALNLDNSTKICQKGSLNIQIGNIKYYLKKELNC